MPRIEIEFDLDMVFCFGIRFAPYAVFPLGFTVNTLHDLLKMIVLYTSCLSERTSVRSSRFDFVWFLHNLTLRGTF